MTASPLVGQGLPRPIPLLVREVKGGLGGEYWLRLLYCPLTRSHMSPNGCARCPHYAGYNLDTSRRRNALMCAYTDEATAHEAHGASVRDRARQTAIGELMSTFVLCLEDDLTCEEVRNVCTSRGIDGAPVVDHGGSLLGIVVRAALRCRSLRPGANITQLMRPVNHTLQVNTSVAQAANLMAFERIHRAPVLADTRVVGMISSVDIVRWLAEHHGQKQSTRHAAPAPLRC